MARLRERSVFADQKITVTAVEALEFRTGRTNRGRFLTASLKPVAVIVREPDRTYALDMCAEPVDIDRLNLLADIDPD